VKAEVKIHDISFFVCKKTMTESVIEAHGMCMQSISDARYPFIRTETRSFNVPKGQLSVTLENPYQSNIPVRMLVGMVLADAKAGHFHKNPLNFQHFDLASAGFYIDDQAIPKKPFIVNPSENVFLQPMMELYSVLGKHGEDKDIGLSREEYMKGMFLLPFDVQPTASGSLQYLAPRKGGHCRLELTFSKPLPANICIVTYATFPATLCIDMARNVRVVELEKPHRVFDDRGTMRTK